MVPITGTARSGIKFFASTQRFLGRLAVEGYEDGWAFKRHNGDRAKTSDNRNNIFTKLENIQATASVIDPDCNIWDDFGVQRSGRWCFATIYTICNIPKHLDELQCRWSIDRENGVRTVQRLMMHNYSEVRNMKDSLVQPSKVF